MNGKTIIKLIYVTCIALVGVGLLEISRAFEAGANGGQHFLVAGFLIFSSVLLFHMVYKDKKEEPQENTKCST